MTMILVFSHSLKDSVTSVSELELFTMKEMMYNMKTSTLENITPFQIVTGVFFPWLFVWREYLQSISNVPLETNLK